MSNTSKVHPAEKMKLPPYSWLVRPCELYKEEYSDCTSIKARFHQYFVHGETVDCSQWKKDYNSCMAWRSSENIDELNSVIKSEKDRRLKRLEAHYRNDVWEKRKEPPPDWDKPLPDWVLERQKNTLLKFKAEEIKKGEWDPENERTFCVLC